MIPDLTTAVWRKSSYSAGGDNDCLEVADGHPGIVPVRDSKIPDRRPLLFGAAPWASFLAAVKS
ncbi:DUF397 domain-containing protein [Streptomyces lanatus]|uniref:DUF397 domain-containing protein n=1 Tax=Streptomyces lanatus TaxID=66900 RepID=A0ABV1Y4U5_9ACTN|nr:DUF397 domain-containing protein [Streptomyces lanatus]GHH28086.1 hypothetical protein GCM10018780_84180 [Streptomyces lanatus]